MEVNVVDERTDVVECELFSNQQQHDQSERRDLTTPIAKADRILTFSTVSHAKATVGLRTAM